MLRVEIINSDQEVTKYIVGKEYNAISMDLDTGDITVYDVSMSSKLALKKTEYKFLI